MTLDGYGNMQSSSCLSSEVSSIVDMYEPERTVYTSCTPAHSEQPASPSSSQ